MLKREQIVYIANDWFTENKTSSHQIAEILSRHNSVLYIEASGQRAPSFSKRDFLKIVGKLKKAWKEPIEVHKNIKLYSPLILPFHKHVLARAINRKMLSISLKRACKAIGFTSPILWIFLPHFSSVVGTQNEKGVVYYCVDEYSAQPNVDPIRIREMEEYLLRRADVAFVVSEELLIKKSKINPNTYLSLHGVDFDLFGHGMTNPSVIPPDDIASLPKPIVGFFGLIQPRVDLDLVRFLAEKRPDVTFVFIGLIAQDISSLNGCKNVHFLGVRAYDKLPSYLKAFDVAILPYRLNEEMINSNPKKLREYMASGKPTVSVRVKEVERYGHLVYIADNYENFLNCLDLALAETSIEKVEARMEAMKKESWESRVDVIGNVISRHIQGVRNE